MKTLAIRLDDEVAAQLAVVAQLEDTSLVEPSVRLSPSYWLPRVATKR